jgi:hypothetical protein
MFGLFKRRKPTPPSSDELESHMVIATGALLTKWTDFHQQLKFKSDVPLSEIIEIFIVPAREYVTSTYPEFSSAPNQVVWMMVFSAVMESGTHSKEAVNEAVAELEVKYAK